MKLKYPPIIYFKSVYTGEPPNLTLNGNALFGNTEDIAEDVVHVIYSYPFIKEYTFRHIATTDNFTKGELYDIIVDTYNSLYLDASQTSLYPMAYHNTDLNKMKLLKIRYCHRSTFDNCPVYKLVIKN
jgi:hypothetical protein